MNILACKSCGKTFPTSDPRWKCDCSGLLELKFEAAFPKEKIAKRKPTMWRYREAIPILNDNNIISFDEGFSPLVPVDFSDRSILIKQEQLFQTGSFKDRGASVLVSKIKELGLGKVVEDSSGNAGCAIAAYCAKAGIGCEIFVPADTSPGKLVQIEAYGAKLQKVPGSREETAKAALIAAESNYYASHYWNPFFFHGTKTFAFEVAEQLGWRAPDTIILPVGNGTLLLGAYIGFSELLNAEIIEKLPKLIGVQATNCAPLFQAFHDNLTEIPKIEKTETIAEGIAIAEPIRGKQIIEAVRTSKGTIIAVDDDEIKRSLKHVIQKGYFIEPTSAVTTAGISKYLETADPKKPIVSVFSGHGLKAAEKIFKILSE